MSGVEIMDTSNVSLNGGYAHNGGGDTIELDDDDNKEVEMFMDVVRRVEMLEKLKIGLDEREQQLKSQLKIKYEDEKVSMKESSEMLVEKEGLRDELIRLKDAREKLIDELQVLKSVDEEMSSFNRINDSFNENLRKHLQLLEEKQAKIYTLKPIITGTQVGCECDFADKERGSIHAALIDILKVNIKQTEDQIRNTCEEFNIKSVSDHNLLLQDEKSIKSRIRVLKSRIKEKQREKQGKKRKETTAASDGSGDESSFSKTPTRSKLMAPASARKRGRSDDPDLVCEACHKQCDDVESFAYHCFRGCSLLEDYMKEQGREISVDCRECHESIGSFNGFTDHLKRIHGWESPEDAKKSASGGSSSQKKRGRR